MRRFYLQRDQDETGVSGTGRVVDGVEFLDGTCVVHWRSQVHSTSVYDNIKTLMMIHGHNDKTRLIWIDQEEA